MAYSCHPLQQWKFQLWWQSRHLCFSPHSILVHLLVHLNALRTARHMWGTSSGFWNVRQRLNIENFSLYINNSRTILISTIMKYQGLSFPLVKNQQKKTNKLLYWQQWIQESSVVSDDFLLLEINRPIYVMFHETQYAAVMDPSIE